MNTDKLAEKIPDIYFDWYARFIPGMVGVIIYFYVSNKMPETTAIYAFIYSLIAYVAGHVCQPLSSILVGFIQKIFTGQKGEGIYSAAKSDNSKAPQCGKISKAHAEAVGMLSSAFIVMLICFQTSTNETITNILWLYFIVVTFERAYARNRKINEL